MIGVKEFTEKKMMKTVKIEIVLELIKLVNFEDRN